MRSVQGQEFLFRLRTGSAVLLENMKSCKMVTDEMCVLCDSG